MEKYVFGIKNYQKADQRIMYIDDNFFVKAYAYNILL